MDPTADEQTLNVEQRLSERDAPPPRAGVVAILGAPGCGGELVARLLGAAGLGTLGGPGATGASVAPLTGVADQVLSALEGTRFALPEMQPGWEDLPEVVALVPAATEALEQVLARTAAEAGAEGTAAEVGAAGTLAWFEPVAAPTLAFWVRHLGVPGAAVVAWRRPEAAVAALAAEGLSVVHTLALWEAYTVHALANTADLPVLGIDVDALVDGAAGGATELARFVAHLGVTVPAGAAERMAEILAEHRSAPVPRAGVEGAEPVLDRHESALRSVSGVHARWKPPAGLAVGPWSEAVLAGHRAAHRSAAQAVEAWIATDEAQVLAEEAQAGAERRIREIAGPDPVQYLEVRREVWRLRDEVLGMQAERAELRVELLRTEARWHTAEHRANAWAGARQERDNMLASKQWKVGRMIVGPFRRLKRMLSGH